VREGAESSKAWRLNGHLGKCGFELRHLSHTVLDWGLAENFAELFASEFQGRIEP
jgi:hypothetical protein